MSRCGRAAAIVVAACVGCHRSPAADDTAASSEPSTALAPALAPADHLAPGELIEGVDDAFGLILPRKLRVDGAFAKVVYASGPVAPRSLVPYFRARLQGGDLREGDTAASFEHVRVPAKPERDLAIHVTGTEQTARVEIRDVTLPEIPVLPDERARWKRVGVTPEGRLLDRTHLE
jgi:hypothetical protein